VSVEKAKQILKDSEAFYNDSKSSLKITTVVRAVSTFLITIAIKYGVFLALRTQSTSLANLFLGLTVLQILTELVGSYQSYSSSRKLREQYELYTEALKKAGITEEQLFEE
jgi:hypothetical protein